MKEAFLILPMFILLQPPPPPSTIGTISPLHLPQKIKVVAAVLKKQQVELPFNETVTKWGEKVKPTD